MKQYLLIALALFAFAAGYWLGRGSVEVTTTERVRIDTVFFERPQPTKILPPTFATVRIPRVLFASGEVVVTPSDTLERTVVVEAGSDSMERTVVVEAGSDSMEIQVAIERRQYGDSTYRAQISGPRIGELGPSLDWIQTYARTTSRVQTVTKRSRFALTAGVGAGYTPQGFQPYIGVGVGVIIWQF